MAIDSQPTASDADISSVQELAKTIRESVQRVIVGKSETIDIAVLALLCRGHVLLEDVPGTGKTTLAKALAASLDCQFGRIQFTPDLVPGDEGEADVHLVLREHVFDHVAVDVGEAALEAVVVVGEAFVIEAQEVEHGCVEIVDGRDIDRGFVAEFVGGAVAEGRLDAGSGEPGGEAGGIVIAAAGAFLKGGHAAELGAPDDERVLEQAALFEISEQGGGGLIEDGTVFGGLRFQCFVPVPVADAFSAGLVGAVEKLDEAHAFFDQPPSEDAVFCEGGFQGI